MRSRLGEPITVAGNPPVKFASASFETEDKTHRLPSFPLFLTRVFLNDIFSIGILPFTEGLIYTIFLYFCLLRLGGQPVTSAVAALILTAVSLVLFSVAIKKFLVGSRWGTDDSTPFWSWRHFAYFFAQDCFFVWCRGALGFFAGTILSNFILRWMGCRIGRRTIVTQPMQCSDWNAVSFGDDCVVDGFLQFHTFENMRLKVKRTHIQDGCAVAFGATVMGGVVIERDTTLLPLSLVLKEMNMPTAAYEGSPAELASDSTLQSLRQVAAAPRASTPQVIDNTDWLKTAAIILVLVDHFGYFFMEDDLWWSVLGRLAAPTFFFLIGYARTHSVPLHWIGLGVFLTLLDSWNADWRWVAPNILLSFALIRIASPYVQTYVQNYGWIAFIILVTALFAVLPLTGKIIDYGAEGWLWALFGLYQRMYADGRSATGTDGATQSSVPIEHAITKHAGLMRLLACLIAAVAYIWQEQIEFSFPQIPFAVFILGVGFLSMSLCLFLRGPSRIQPPQAIAGVIGFIGRHTLEIYAVQLAASEIIIKLLPGLSD
jgi:hypothetical protein